MIDHSNYSCDKCTREFSRHCKHCQHTAEKPPTRFKRKKKTGCETPECKPTPSPLPATQFEDKHRTPKLIHKILVGTEDRLCNFMSTYEDILKIENAEVYWSIKDGVMAIVTTQEWKDYLTGRTNIIPNTKENIND